jgi:hypothetical protein
MSTDNRQLEFCVDHLNYNFPRGILVTGRVHNDDIFLNDEFQYIVHYNYPSRGDQRREVTIEPKKPILLRVTYIFTAGKERTLAPSNYTATLELAGGDVETLKQYDVLGSENWTLPESRGDGTKYIYLGKLD